MYLRNTQAKRLLRATYLIYDKVTGTFGQPASGSFYTNSTNPRNINDIAARYARENGIKWDKLIVRNLLGTTVSERTRMYYNTK